MKIHIITVGTPKLAYAKTGWDEYLTRLKHYHTVRVTHIADKWAHDAKYLLQTAGNAYKIALVIEGRAYASPELATFLEKCALTGREVCFIVGGPEGLPPEVIDQADTTWSLSKLTFPHDLAMIVMLEALYRASSITGGHPYHK